MLAGKIHSTNFRVITKLLFLGMLCFLSSTPCLAAEGDKSSQKTILDDITVTAEKREENVQKVTSSLNVLSDTEIEDAQIDSTREIWKYVPNMRTSYTGTRSYFSRITVRGISNTAFGDPGVALYIDDVSYADVYAFDNILYDIERIEVLKGPQGTLYGKNTEGGVINVITKAPSNEFEGKVSAEYGSYNAWRIDSYINAPLIKDKMFLRVAALKSAREGVIENVWTDQDVDSQDTLAGYGSLLFNPIEKLSFNLTFRAHSFDDSDGFPMLPMDKDMFAAATGVTNIGDFETAYNYGGESSVESNTTSLRVKYEHDMFDIISVTAYKNIKNEDDIDGELTPSALYIGLESTETESLTQELRLQSNDSWESFKWLLGLYYGRDEKAHTLGAVFDSDYASMMGVPLNTSMYDIAANIDAEDMAVFGQSTVRFIDNALGLTFGLRYERSKRSMDRYHTELGIDPVVMEGLEDTYSQLLPKFAIDYLISDDIMAYASVARGYKSGGFSYATDDAELTRFDPEVSTAYELGLKTEFPELRLRVNLAAFYTKVDDYQDRVSFDYFTVIQANVMEADIYGFEFEAFYALTDTISVSGFFGYTNAKYGEYIDSITGDNYEDNNIVLSPEIESGLFVTYRNQLGIFARAEMQLVGTTYFDRANTRKQDAYSLFNVKLGYEQETWDVYLSVKNITDKQYFMEAIDYSDTGFMGTVGDPRTISLVFNYRF